MKSTVFLIIFVCFFIKAHSNIGLHARDNKLPINIEIKIHDSIKLPISNQNIWIEKSSVLKAKAIGSQLELRALNIGESIVRIGKDEYNVNVLSKKSYHSISALNKITQKNIDTHIRYADGKIFLDGNIYSSKEIKILSRECPSCEYAISAKLSADAMRELQQSYSQKLKKYNLDNQLIESSDIQQVRISKGHKLFSKYKIVGDMFGLQTIESDERVEDTPLIKIQIQIVEVKKNEWKKIGVNWPEAYTATLLPNGTTEGSNSAFNINAIEQNGLGKILASPNILCRSGKEAEFFAGGEFPIKIITPRTREIQWKKYGLLLKTKPVADSTGHMSIGLETEISSLDESKSIDDVPGLFTNKVQSFFDLKEPRTIALSGLIKNEESNNSEGLPFLNKIPILGSLFGSKSFRENKTELVVFVRPEIIKGDVQYAIIK